MYPDHERINGQDIFFSDSIFPAIRVLKKNRPLRSYADKKQWILVRSKIPTSVFDVVFFKMIE